MAIGNRSLWVYTRSYSVLRSWAFRFGLLGGLAGMVVDVDHLLVFFAPDKFGPRAFHPVLLLLASAMVIGIGAYLTGLYLWPVLRKRIMLRGKTMKTWSLGKVLLILLAMVLTAYPILELSRLIVNYPEHYSLYATDLELFLMWWAWLSMPFILWSIASYLEKQW